MELYSWFMLAAASLIGLLWVLYSLSWLDQQEAQPQPAASQEMHEQSDKRSVSTRPAQNASPAAAVLADPSSTTSARAMPEAVHEKGEPLKQHHFLAKMLLQ